MSEKGCQLETLSRKELLSLHHNCYQLKESENEIRRAVCSLSSFSHRTGHDLYVYTRLNNRKMCLRFTFVVKREMWIIGSRAGG